MTYTESAIIFINRFSKRLAHINLMNKNRDITVKKIRHTVECHNKRFGDKIQCEYGQTRLVFVGKDFVVKVDYGNHVSKYGGCKEELLAYNFAKRNRMEKLFAKISQYHHNGIDFYIMPKVEVANDMEDDFEYFCELISPDEDAFLSDYFEEDFHPKNFGLLNGKWVLIDYAWHYIKM